MAAVITTHTGEHGNGSHEEKNYLEVQKGIGSWLYTLDHKRIGVMYLMSVTLAFLLGGIYDRAVVVGNQTFAVAGALVLGRHLLEAPGVAAGVGFGILLLGAVLFGVVLRRLPGP